MLEQRALQKIEWVAEESQAPTQHNTRSIARRTQAPEACVTKVSARAWCMSYNVDPMQDQWKPKKNALHYREWRMPEHSVTENEAQGYARCNSLRNAMHDPKTEANALRKQKPEQCQRPKRYQEGRCTNSQKFMLEWAATTPIDPRAKHIIKQQLYN